MLAALCLSLLPVGIPVAHADVPTAGDDRLNTATTQSTASYGNYVGGSQDKSQPPTDDIGCLIGAGGPANTIALCMSNIVYYIMVGVGSSFAYICAFFFDLAIQLSLNSTTYALSFLTTSWTIVRDLSNMAFIFILIYIAIQVMLSADTGQTLKTLAIVVVVALLVNFSFFFTRVAIDAGNLLALQFYNAIQAPNISATGASSLSSALSGGVTNNQGVTSAIPSNLYALASSGNTKDLTASIMNGIQVQNIINSNSFKQYTAANQGIASSMYILIALSTIYIAVGVAFGMLGGTFLYVGAKFMLRIVGLWFVIIFSPLALVAATIPQSKKLFNTWLKHLVNFSFYPAVFLFMFFVLSRFMVSLNTGTNGQPGNFLNGVFSQSLTASNDISLAFLNILSAIANVGVRLGFVMAMMYVALSAADMLAKYRGDITTPWARSTAGWLGNAITGGAMGWTGRNAVRLGNYVSGDRLGGQGLTFDPRNSRLGRWSGISTLLRGYNPTTDPLHKEYGALPINFGKAHGYDEAQKRKERAAKARENALQKAADKAVTDKEEAGKKKKPEATTSDQAPTTPAPQNPNPGGGGGGGARIPQQNGGQNRMTNAPGTTNLARPGATPAPQGNSAASIVGSIAAQRAVQGLYKQAAAEKAKDASATRGLYLQKQGEDLKKQPTAEFEQRVANLQKQGEDIKQLVQNQSEQLRKTAAQVAVAAALAQEPNMSRGSGNRIEAQRVAAPAQREMSPEMMQQMKKLMRTVIRKEVPNIVESVAESRPPEPPRTPAGVAQRPTPPKADNDDNFGEIKKAA